MNELLFPLIAVILSAASTFLIMPRLLKVCYKRGLYDLPDNRKVHKHGIPRLGGIVFVPATLIGLFCTFGIMILMGTPSPDAFHFSSLVIGGGAILTYFVGAIDDLVGCSAKFKLAVQLCAAITFPLCGLRIDSLYGFMGIEELPLIVSYAITIILTILIINAVNLIDGIDGLAGSLSLIALIAYGILFNNLQVPAFALLSAALSGSIMAFLFFNLKGTPERRTKTFMGDSGSLLLGLVLSYFTMKYAMKHSETLNDRPDGLLMAYTILIVPCFDLCRVAICRLLHGHGIFDPDKTHIHHKFMAYGFTMFQTLTAIVTLQILLIATNIGLFYMHVSMEWIVAIDILVFTILNIFLPVERGGK